MLTPLQDHRLNNTLWTRRFLLLCRGRFHWFNSYRFLQDPEHRVSETDEHYAHEMGYLYVLGKVLQRLLSPFSSACHPLFSLVHLTNFLVPSLRRFLVFQIFVNEDTNLVT